MTAPPPIPSRPVIAPPPIPARELGSNSALELVSDGLSARSGPLTAPSSSGDKKQARLGMKWQASGPLWAGNGLDSSQPVQIERCCWTFSLDGPGRNVDAKGRQRTELMSWPPAQAGETWVYKWRYHLSSSSLCPPSPCSPNASFVSACGPHRVASSSKFFHLTQLLSREQGGFIVALSLLNDRICIGSQLCPPGEDPSSKQWKKRLPQIERERFEGRTTVHRVEIKWGAGGHVHYTIRGLSAAPSPDPPELLIDYRVAGVDVPALGSLKTGLYRAFVPEVNGECAAVAGDFDFFRRA